MSWIDDLEKTFVGEGNNPSPPPPKNPRHRWLKILSAVATFLRRGERGRNNMLIYNPDNRSEATIVKEEIPDDTPEIIDDKPQLPIPAITPARPMPKPAKPARKPSLWSWPLVVIAFGFYVCAIWINALNAGGWTNLASNPMVVLGILAESGLFFLMPRAIHGPDRCVVIALCALLMGFALWNDLRVASITAADAELARADRQTTGITKADAELDKARAAQSRDCGAGQGKSKACALAQTGVAKAEDAAKLAQAKVIAVAKPETQSFVKFMAWVSFGTLRPTADDFDMWGLLFRMVLPQLGGLILALARR